MENVKKVNDELTLAGQVTPEQLQQAAAEGFKSVMNLRSPDEPGSLADEQQQVQALGLAYSQIPVKPDTLTPELAVQVLQEIDRLPKPALIHCASGTRVGYMALMNIATKQGMTLQEAFNLAERVGFDLNANPRLKEFFTNYVSENSPGSASD
jgi:uncharacterized protein (TIGR01244 family)